MKFSDVIGNEAAASRIRRMVDEDRFPHALLIHGQAGVPKLALAQATAQYIHCTNRTPDGNELNPPTASRAVSAPRVSSTKVSTMPTPSSPTLS